MHREKQAETENAVPNTDSAKPWQFQPGQSGNPAGKPRGVKHRATQAVQTMLVGELEALTRKAVEKALEGDIAALKLCLDRIAPPLRPTAMTIDIQIPAEATLTDTARAFVSAAAAGELPPDIAAQLVTAVAGVAKVEELESIKDRLEALERALKGGRN